MKPWVKAVIWIGGGWAAGFVAGAEVEVPTSFRYFLYIASEPNYEEKWIIGRGKQRFPPSDLFRGVRFPPGTTLEFLGDDGKNFTVTSYGGEPFSFEKEFWTPGWGLAYKSVDYQVLSVPWDMQKQRPFCLSDSRNGSTDTSSS